MICFSETYLDYFTLDDQKLNINGCKLIRTINPSNNKKGGVFILKYLF